MKSFCILGVFLLSVFQLEATSVSQFACVKRNLSVTVDDEFWLYIDGVEITDLPNVGNYQLPDVVDLPCTTRLIAIHGKNGLPETPAGILASTGDDYVLTNSSWKCSNVNHNGWEEIDFDDSAWMSAVEYGHNGEGAWESIPGISSNAAWIWLKQDISSPDVDVYCRKRLAPSYCLSSPCAFGSTCIDEPNGGYCICAPGYTGLDCSVEINYCESDPCSNGGTCLPIFNGYVCQCPPGYTGDHCQSEINYCESDPCANGGSCLPIFNGYVCQCPSGYTGEHCQHEINYCESVPCVNGGSCLPIINGYVCQCPPGYTGDHCQHDDTCNAYQPVACSSDDIAIAMSALFSVSFAVNITILITWLCKTFPAIKDPFQMPENFLPTEITDLSNVSSAPSPFEELRRPDESQLHQNNYEQLTSTISHGNDKQSRKQN